MDAVKKFKLSLTEDQKAILWSNNVDGRIDLRKVFEKSQEAFESPTIDTITDKAGYLGIFRRKKKELEEFTW